MTLFWHSTGPLMTYDDGMLKMSQLNPETDMRWRMSRGEMLRLAWRCLIAGLWR